MGKDKALVIVESPAKARTISKFLGKEYTVEASIGHIRDLPQGKKEVPEKFKQEDWAYLGVNVDEDFEPVYIVPADKKKHVSKLKQLLKDADALYLATDEDREGEAISWHLHEVLKPKVPVHRLVFHEITKEAIQHALEATRQIDDNLVNAQETRRILDRLYGFDMSNLLWRKIGKGTSAGRVQSVAVRLIVQRERERIAFVDATYWDLEAVFDTAKGESMAATLTSVEGRKIPSGKDFDSKTGQLKDETLLKLSEAEANELMAKLKTADFAVSKVEVKPFTERPRPPFTTSTLQQEANRKLGFTAQRTMSAAQRLYENGYITYMRTDSTTLSNEAVTAARNLVGTVYGEKFLHPEVRVYKGKVKNAQEAHEAIRPAGTEFPTPESLRSQLDSDQFRVYDLVWKRTVACQMADAKKQRMSIIIDGGGATFSASGTSILFEGFLRAYVEGSDDPDAELANRDKILPQVAESDPLTPSNLDPKSHTTQPPARYTEATLTRMLEEKGIGRPSTYASIIGTITDERRNYIVKKGTALVPTWRAFSVTRLMEQHFGTLVEEEPIGFHPELGKPIFVKVGRFGPYIQLGDPDDPEKRNQGLLKGMEVEDLTLDLACKLLELPRTLGNFPDNNEPILACDGRYGPYVKCDKENRSLPEGMSPLEITLEQAIELLKQPKTRGKRAPKEPLRLFEQKSPVTEGEVKILDGRFGPYVTDGETNASLRKGMDAKEMTFEAALDLLAERAALGPSKKKKKKKAAKKKAPAKKKAAKTAKKATAKKKTAKKKTPAKKKAAKKSETPEIAAESSADTDAS